MDGADWVFLGVGVFFAITALARLMISHRNQLLIRLRNEMEEERRRQKKSKVQSPKSKVGA